MRGSSSKARVILKGFVVLLLGAALVHGIATLVLGRRVEGRINAYRAQGAPVSMSDLAGPAIPDAENGSVIINQVQEEIRNPSVKGTPSEQEQADLALKTVSRRQEVAPAPEVWAAARAYSSPMRRLLPRLEEAAARPRCRYHTNWEDGGVKVIFPHFAGMRELARRLGVTAAVSAHDGDLDETVRALAASYRVGDSIREEPTLIGMLVRSAIYRMTSNSLKACAEHGEFHADQARRLYDVLSSASMREGSRIPMEGERAFGIWFFKAIPRHKTSLTGEEFAGQTDPETGLRALLMKRIVPSYAWRPFLYADQLQYLRLADRAVEMQDRPYRDIAARPEKARLPRYAVVTPLVMPVPISSKVQAKRDEAEASLRGDQVFLALLAYRDGHGHYPDSLRELRDGLGWKLGEDPFSGRDFVYRREGRGFLLYSIGSNMKDEGGRSRFTGARPRDREDDIAWHMKR